MNYIIKCGRNIAAISDRVQAGSHKHWLLQMFITSTKKLNIEVNGELIPCDAILVNTDTKHTFDTKGDVHFTMLIDPTTELGRSMRCLLKDQPFYVFPNEEAKVIQQDFLNALTQKDHGALISFVQSIILQFTSGDVSVFDDRIIKVLDLLDGCAHEDEQHQIKYFSKETYLSESRLAHLFKEETGIPLKSYIVLHKLQRAYEPIFNGENITTAALSAGFDSPSHLAYTNKMMTGMSATDIIKDSEFLKVF
jgi:AraC-like DNA-binding protein